MSKIRQIILITILLFSMSTAALAGGGMSRVKNQQTAPEDRISDLPRDMRMMIFNYLKDDAESLVNCSEVSNQCNEVLSTFDHYQLEIIKPIIYQARKVLRQNNPQRLLKHLKLFVQLIEDKENEIETLEEKNSLHLKLALVNTQIAHLLVKKAFQSPIQNLEVSADLIATGSRLSGVSEDEKSSLSLAKVFFERRSREIFEEETNHRSGESSLLKWISMSAVFIPLYVTPSKY